MAFQLSNLIRNNTTAATVYLMAYTFAKIYILPTAVRVHDYVLDVSDMVNAATLAVRVLIIKLTTRNKRFPRRYVVKATMYETSADVTYLVKYFYANAKIISVASMYRWLKRFIPDPKTVSVVFMRDGTLRASRFDLDSEMEYETGTYISGGDVSLKRLPSVTVYGCTLHSRRKSPESNRACTRESEFDHGLKSDNDERIYVRPCGGGGGTSDSTSTSDSSWETESDTGADSVYIYDSDETIYAGDDSIYADDSVYVDDSVYTDAVGDCDNEIYNNDNDIAWGGYTGAIKRYRYSNDFGIPTRMHH